MVTGWNSTALHGNYTILDRIRECRKSVALCKQRNNLNASKRIEELKDELDFALASWGDARRRIPGLKKDLAMAYREEESYWKTKSRNNWLEEGDRTPKYFHACVKVRYSHNRIHATKDSMGNAYRGDRAIGQHARFLRILTKSLHKISQMMKFIKLFVQSEQIRPHAQMVFQHDFIKNVGI